MASSPAAGAGLPQLAQLLHTDAAKLDFLSALSASDQTQLAADVKSAHEAHAAHIKSKMAEALDHLPWLLRAPMKKLFGI